MALSTSTAPSRPRVSLPSSNSKHRSRNRASHHDFGTTRFQVSDKIGRVRARRSRVINCAHATPFWRRRTNVWRRVTSPERGAKRLRGETANGQRHDARGRQINRAPSRAHPAQGALWRLSGELPRRKRECGLLLAFHRRRIRVLELEPILRPAGSVARPEPLRHDAFEAHLAGVQEYALAIVGEVLVQTQTRKAPTQQARERHLARLQRLPPQVLAIQLEEVEGVEEDMLARRLAPKPFEHRESVLIAGHGLAVDQAGTRLEPVNGLDDERIARCPIVPVSG